ncbi:SCP2 sterol-binding domain-containing protein [Thetidibacter halocola]|uniref:SCP2 sterol-binding domain-containing protein n=1 Tax=Thetidibacter halocola TaxID=2827239 RepID=A0A8J7W9N6_9RHOB|nr:SCP2 sterol-binding domain-containing protein [Thetidibacter halocola]MBS0123487.1 SCP2 sterol-binding domain-containing protein [Thetidibacter halocola]
MNLDDIAALIRKGLGRKPLDNSLTFDCGADGMLRLEGTEAVLSTDPADCTIRISQANLEKLVQGQLNPMTAFALGKIKVSGDMSVALKLGQLL